MNTSECGRQSARKQLSRPRPKQDVNPLPHPIPHLWCVKSPAWRLRVSVRGKRQQTFGDTRWRQWQLQLIVTIAMATRTINSGFPFVSTHRPITWLSWDLQHTFGGPHLTRGEGRVMKLAETRRAWHHRTLTFFLIFCRPPRMAVTRLGAIIRIFCPYESRWRCCFFLPLFPSAPAFTLLLLR